MKKFLSLLVCLVLLLTALVPVSVSASTPTTTAALWQLDVDNTSADGGMSYVIRCTDGKFIIIDGGYDTEKEADNLYGILRDNNVLDGNPVVEAWFITHSHEDHIGGLLAFTKKYDESDVTVNSFYYNLPLPSEVEAAKSSLVTKVNNAAAEWSGAVVDDEITRGDSFTFSGVKFDVLSTWKDVNQSYYIGSNSEGQKINDTSTVFKVTIGEQTIMFLGDAYKGVSDALERLCSSSDLKSDIVQVAHHGFDDGVTSSLYNKIDADVAIWPMDVVRMKDGEIIAGAVGDTKTFIHYYNKNSGQSTVYNAASDVYPAYKNEMLTFPYVVKNNKPSKNVLDYWLNVANEAVVMNIAELVNGADISWYDPGKSVYYLYTAADLLGLSALAKGGQNFAGKTVRLMADIDLNPGWDASTQISVNGTVTLASEPATKWLPIPKFSGTLDGNGYKISGIYTSVDYAVPSADARYMGGFIDVLEGATVQDLIVDNSLAYFTSSTAATGTNRIRIGGLFARVLDSTLDTIYADIDCWHKLPYHYTMGGMICEVGTAQEDFYYDGSISNLVYAGSTGRICSDGKWTSAEGTSRIYSAGMIAQNHNASNGSTFCYVTLENLSFIGTAFRAQANTACTFDALLAYTGGTGYSSGIAANNCTWYCYGAFDSNNPTVTATSVSNVELGDEAFDYTNRQGSPTAGDTYDADNWTAVAFDNDAEVAEPILLPKTVVDMLNNSAYGSLAVQESDDGTAVRFVGILRLGEAELSSFSALQMTVTMEYEGTHTYTATTHTVYESILADGKTITASELGGDYFYMVEITDMDDATQDVDFNVSVAILTETATEVYGSAAYTFKIN